VSLSCLYNDYVQLHQSNTARWSQQLFKEAWLKISENIGVALAKLMDDAHIERNAL